MPKLFADRQQELRRCHARIEDQRDLGVLRRLRQQRPNYRGLAGADFAGELDEAASFVDAVDQVRERLRVPFREEQVARIRRDRERLFVEAEERGVHGSLRRRIAAFNGPASITRAFRRGSYRTARAAA